ncbi:MAG TPA: hypothetical protein VHU91_11235 [Mycobacteriales bacterium]|jgi:hypothetical protein|nr:hypothetical protein [Mycobacteriales bacterium]
MNLGARVTFSRAALIGAALAIGVTGLSAVTSPAYAEAGSCGYSSLSDGGFVYTNCKDIAADVDFRYTDQDGHSHTAWRCVDPHTAAYFTNPFSYDGLPIANPRYLGDRYPAAYTNSQGLCD